MKQAEFHGWLNAEFEKYPLIKLSYKRGMLSLNELIHVLRLSGKDFCVNIEDPDDPMCFGFIPSVQETLIPTRDLARKVDTIVHEDCKEAESDVLTVRFLPKNE